MKNILFVLSLFSIGIFSSYSQDFNVLVFHETNGFRHTGAINASISMLEDLGANAEHDTWSVEATRDASIFTTENLANYEVIVFSNTTGGDLLDDSQQAAMETFIQNGGGFIGFHSATDTYRNTNEGSSWPWYNELVGAIVQTSPNHTSNNLPGIMNVLVDHPVIDHIGSVGDTWAHEEEWYYWELNGGQLSDTNENLLEVESTGGQSYDATRPITWLKEFDGGRSFYTALGHNGATYNNNETFREMIEKAVLWTADRLDPNTSENDCGADLTNSWTDLLENDLECWEKFMGVPHTSTGLPGSSNNVTNGSGTPLGLDNDPTNVFSIIEVDGEKQLYISGEVYGGLTTLNEYSNYHLSMEFKWGELKWEPRLNLLRDSGILYHCQGEHGTFWDVWKSSLEFQVQEGDLGDYIGLAGSRGLVPSENRGGLTFTPMGTLNTGTLIRAGTNPEYPNGEWNLLEVIVIGDRAIHYVNGVMVNALQDATRNGTTLTSGQIQIQSEGAELYYRNIRIKAEDEFPEEDVATLGWGDDPSIPTCDTNAPIGKMIALRKSGGDQKWITINEANSNLIANGEEADRELFYIEEHPNGCIALKSVNTDKYVQVVGGNQNVSIRANGNAPGTWENFGWEQKGDNQVALQSLFNNGWIQADWDVDNSALFPQGNTDGTEETFDFVIIDNVPTATAVHITKRNASGFAIDGDWGGTNGQNVYLWSENENNINQQWIEIDQGNGYYSYQKQGTNYCIDGDHGGINGQNVYLWTCAENNQNQHWEKVAVGGGAFKLIKRNAPDFAINGGSNGANGQNVNLFDSSETSENLHWIITPIGGPVRAPEVIVPQEIQLYPNPVIKTATILGASGSTARVYDFNGKLLLTKNITEDSATINMSALAKGMYYVKIIGLQEKSVMKILKQ
ncbi:ThuA domain-containing protein [uncultured Aquimarina sp.]|uniref:ThuA domain-containing protein n=1 Tax=uncultured Aquimarina sp. TaxID=575652 RepID=UPI002609BE4C|nr:ThuA domain-containing protein [uncultured Aquimarina sp.]